MRKTQALVLLSAISSCSVHAVENSRPRGVGPEFAKFYKSTESFTCISNPSVTLDVSQINDDYCDCPDGSDEPGTSACAHLSELSLQHGDALRVGLALPGFYCKNKGHVPGYVSHTFVNDGVCDYDACCDGSDEWAGVGGVRCEDRCKEIGKEWRRMDEGRQKSARSALRIKDELVREAQSARAGVELSIGRLEVEVQGLEGQAEVLKEKYEELERRERGRVVTSKGKGSKTTVLAGLAKKRVGELRGALLEVVGKRDVLREKVAELEAILSKFSDEYNPNFNDEGVKRAVKSWQDYAAQKVAAGESDDSAEDRDIESISKEDDDSEGINWAEWETEEESEVDAIYAFEEYLPAPLRTWLHAKLTDLRILLIENGILADNANSGSESKAVTDARAAYQEVADDLSSKKSAIGDQQSDLTKDYGRDDIFRALKGKCVTKDSGEYTYELCWMDNTAQKSKKGHGNTGMGNFVRFDKLIVDEEVGADGKGLGQGERVVLKYENGQNCWNGPNRETTVVLACAETNEIWKVMEMEKCVYRMEVGTPAVCWKASPSKDGAKGKDEL